MKNLIIVKLFFVVIVFTLVSCEKDMPYSADQIQSESQIDLRKSQHTLFENITVLVDSYSTSFWLYEIEVDGIMSVGVSNIEGNNITIQVTTDDSFTDGQFGLKNHTTGEMQLVSILPGQVNFLQFDYDETDNSLIAVVCILAM